MIAIFCFYDIASGKQSRLAFSKEFKHCSLITFDGEHWINWEFDRLGLHIRLLRVIDAGRFIYHLKLIKELTAVVAVWIDNRAYTTWKPLLIRSCNEFARYISGIDIGLTFNPKHLFSKILKYDSIRNYQILHAWRRYGIIRRRQ